MSRGPSRPIRAVAACLVWAVFSSACAHAVHVHSEPPGAEVTLDGVKLGRTPVSFTDEASTGNSYQLVLRKEGFREERAVLEQKVQGWRVGVSVIGGLLLLVPFIGLLWSWELPEDEYRFELQPAAQRAPAETAPGDVSSSDTEGLEPPARDEGGELEEEGGERALETR